MRSEARTGRTRASRTSLKAQLVVVTALVVAVIVGSGRDAGASSGGAGATAAGDEIITSILAAGSGTGGGVGPGGRHGTTPRCSTHVLSDRQIIYLLHVAANMPDLLRPSFLEALDAFTNTAVTAHPRGASTGPTTTVTPGTPPSTTPPNTGPPITGPPNTGPPDTQPATTTSTLPVATEPTVTYWELTVRICDGVADTMSVRPRTASTAVLGASVLAGDRLRHTTRLPPPVLRISPPPRSGPTGVISSTIVGEPVFFSADPPDTVRETVPFGGRTVDVEARPDHLELFSGEPQSAGRVRRCNGLGSAYDPGSPASATRQASIEGACVLVFEHVTGFPRRDVWHGYAALEWQGRYRVDGGPWLPLDGLFSTSVFAVSVGEVDTVIGNG